MSRISDLIDTLGVAEDGMTPIYPDTFRDDILTAGAADADLAAAELAAVTAQRDAAASEVVTLKAYIADYIVNGSAAEPDETDDLSGGGDDETDDGPELTGVDGLFAKMAETTKEN